MLLKRILTSLLTAALMAPATAQYAHDNFEKAKEISADTRVESSLKVDNPDGLGWEPGEISHAGRKGSGSLWFKWTPKKNRRVLIRAIPNNGAPEMMLILAIYTGNSLETLKPVPCSSDFKTPAESRARTDAFNDGVRIEMDVAKGVTYYLAVDSETPEKVGRFRLTIESSKRTFRPARQILGGNTPWEYYLPLSLTQVSINDFGKLWTRPSQPNQLKFLKEGFSPIGYGNAHKTVLRTNLGGDPKFDPGGKTTYTAYFRTTFTPEDDITALGVEGVFNNGAIIYINGKEQHRINISPDALTERWDVLGLGQIEGLKEAEHPVEYATLSGLSLPAGQPVDVAVSLHRLPKNNYNMLFAMKLFAVDTK